MATQIAKQKGLLNEILCQKWMCQNIKIEDINRKRNEIVRSNCRVKTVSTGLVSKDKYVNQLFRDL